MTDAAPEDADHPSDDEGPAEYSVKRYPFLRWPERDADTPSDGTKIRICALHGNGANSNVMLWQTDMLRKMLGDAAEWDLLNGDDTWTWESAGNDYDTTVTPDLRHNTNIPIIMKGAARGMPNLGWHAVTMDDNTGPGDGSGPLIAHQKLLAQNTPMYYNKQLDASAERVLRHIRKQGPYDVLLGFSSGTVVINVITGLLRERGEPVPWKLSVLFSPTKFLDKRFDNLWAPGPFVNPTILCWGRKGGKTYEDKINGADWCSDYSKKIVTTMYKKPIVMEHNGGHELPRSGNIEKQTCKKIAKEILKACGKKEVKLAEDKDDTDDKDDKA